LSAAAVSVRASGLTHRYGRLRTGVDQLSFAFEGPGLVAVTGPNGSGKSTLLRILAGLLRPSGGSTTVSFEGRELPRALRRTHTGLASPELSFYDELSGEENLAFAAEARGTPAPSSVARAALERVGLARRGRDRVAGYSSGMKQRLRLAFALLHEPPLLLLDEPASHLDDEGRAAADRAVREAAARGLVLVATNDPEEVRLAGQRLALVARGLGDPA
jgi:heme exporter protein A